VASYWRQLDVGVERFCYGAHLGCFKKTVSLYTHHREISALGLACQRGLRRTQSFDHSTLVFTLVCEEKETHFFSLALSQHGLLQCGHYLTCTIRGACFAWRLALRTLTMLKGLHDTQLSATDLAACMSWFSRLNVMIPSQGLPSYCTVDCSL
jgi:hypothetical protein